MPLVRLIAEGVGPFERLDLDLSDGNGKPHLGPHILAGVNGSGKSTALRTIAWVLSQAGKGFPFESWEQMLKGHAHSDAFLMISPEGGEPYGISTHALRGQPSGLDPIASGWDELREHARRWMETSYAFCQSNSSPKWTPNRPFVNQPDAHTSTSLGSILWRWHQPAAPQPVELKPLFAVAYSALRPIGYLENPDLRATLSGPDEDSLGFERTPQNEKIQSWIVNLFSRGAIARDRGASSEEFTRPRTRIEAALGAVCDESVSFDVDLAERWLQPTVKIKGRSSNFSQLPDGVRSTLSWVTDFIMRQELDRRGSAGGNRPAVLLLDEADTHLHPSWQRRLLPALRAALPDVQIIVTSHSPFVISSCPGARVHVMEVDEQGRASARPPVDSPFGASVMTTLKDIFGVNSRFDVQTERELNEWNELKRAAAVGKLSGQDSDRLVELKRNLANRSEELRSIVGAPE